MRGYGGGSGRGTHRDGQVVAAGELGDLANVAEGGTHDDGLVAVLLVVVEDLLYGLDTGVFVALVGLSGGFLIPVKDLSDWGKLVSIELAVMKLHAHVQQRARST